MGSIDCQRSSTQNRTIMLSRCLNPNCGRPFCYLDEGRIFRIEQVRAVAGKPDPQRSVESYWLCGTCSGRLKVIIEDGCVLTSPIDVKTALAQQSRELTSVL